MNCPAYDIVYTIYSSTLPEVRQKEMKNWLKMYHEQFSLDLKAFGYNSDLMYPFDKFKMDFDNLFEFGFVHALFNSMVSAYLIVNTLRSLLDEQSILSKQGSMFLENQLSK